MLFIETVILKNFQSHKDTTVTLSPGLNIFVGETDQGKTSLAKRGIQWALFNEPNGNSFVRYKDNGKLDKNGEIEREDECSVTLIFSNGSYIIRKRLKSKNIYEVCDENGEVFLFENFGNTVPSKVVEISGVSKLVVDEDLQLNLNIIGAKDKSLIQESNGVKSKVIGSFAGTNAIDAAIRGIQSDVKGISSEIKHLEKDIDNLNKSIDDLGDISKKEELVNNIEFTFFNLSETNYLINQLIDINKNIKIKKEEIVELELTLKDKEKISKREELLSKIEDKYNSKKDIENRITTLQKILKNINEKNTEIEKCNEILKNKEYILEKESRFNSIISKVDEFKEKIKETKNKEIILEKIQKDILNTKNSLYTLEKEIKRYKDILKKEKALNDLEIKYKSIVEKVNNTVNKISDLVDLNNHIKDLENKMEIAKEWIPKQRGILDNYISECIMLIEQLGKCPICMSNLDSGHLEKIKEELLQ